MERYLDYHKFIAIAQNAMAAGAEIKPPVLKWDTAPDCARPYQVVFRSWKAEKAYLPQASFQEMDAMSIEILTPCRKCENCLKAKRRLWTRRAEHEVHVSRRTWFVTLTIRPEDRVRFLYEAGGKDNFAAYGPISKAFTRFLKRLRKAGYKFRYLMAAEAHKDGYPHLHMLLHEIEGYAAIPKREIERQWPYGFTKVKLCDNGTARYVCKYLAKDMKARVRASLKYGEGASGPDAFENSRCRIIL